MNQEWYQEGAVWLADDNREKVLTRKDDGTYFFKDHASPGKSFPGSGHDTALQACERFQDKWTYLRSHFVLPIGTVVKGRDGETAFRIVVPCPRYIRKDSAGRDYTWSIRLQEDQSLHPGEAPLYASGGWNIVEDHGISVNKRKRIVQRTIKNWCEKDNDPRFTRTI